MQTSLEGCLQICKRYSQQGTLTLTCGTQVCFRVDGEQFPGQTSITLWTPYAPKLGKNKQAVQIRLIPSLTFGESVPDHFPEEPFPEHRTDPAVIVGGRVTVLAQSGGVSCPQPLAINFPPIGVLD